MISFQYFVPFDVYTNILSGSLVCAMIIKAMNIQAMKSIGTQFIPLLPHGVLSPILFEIVTLYIL